MRFLLWLIGFLVTIQIAAFAVMNRDPVSVILNPLGAPLEVPLYAIGLSYVAFGFMIGAATVWINGASIRKAKRQQRKTIKTLEKELAAEQQNALKQEPQTTLANPPPSLNTGISP
jgi:uncharacterized integral membrane protein